MEPQENNIIENGNIKKLSDKTLKETENSLSPEAILLLSWNNIHEVGHDSYDPSQALLHITSNFNGLKDSELKCYHLKGMKDSFNESLGLTSKFLGNEEQQHHKISQIAALSEAVQNLASRNFTEEEIKEWIVT